MKHFRSDTIIIISLSFKQMDTQRNTVKVSKENDILKKVQDARIPTGPKSICDVLSNYSRLAQSE